MRVAVGFVYLAVILDAFSREFIEYVLASDENYPFCGQLEVSAPLSEERIPADEFGTIMCRVTLNMRRNKPSQYRQCSLGSFIPCMAVVEPQAVTETMLR